MAAYLGVIPKDKVRVMLDVARSVPVVGKLLSAEVPEKAAPAKAKPAPKKRK